MGKIFTLSVDNYVSKWKIEVESKLRLTNIYQTTTTRPAHLLIHLVLMMALWDGCYCYRQVFPEQMEGLRDTVTCPWPQPVPTAVRMADLVAGVRSSDFIWNLHLVPSGLWAFLGLYHWSPCSWLADGRVPTSLSFCDCMSQYFLIILLYTCTRLLLVLFGGEH